MGFCKPRTSKAWLKNIKDEIMNAVDMNLIDGVYVSKHAVIAGDVSIGKGSNIWPYVSIRGDVAAIKVGERVSIQDQVMLHCRHKIDLEIGDDVVIGSGAQIIGPVKVGNGARIAANAVVVKDVPESATMVGIPAKNVGMANEEFKPYAVTDESEK